MTMPKQLIIAGFHRSGTSMLTQEFANGGLYVGERLLGSHISNADGHFEDFDFYTLHEKILKFNHQSWQISTDTFLEVPLHYQDEMKRICLHRNVMHEEWGFKDPRTCHFLEAWSQKLDNPYVVAIYRHFEACVNSLLHRASREILLNGAVDSSFWQDPTLAYRMWLAYNKKIIAYAKAHPQTTIVISHEAVLDGFPIVQKVVQTFGFTLKPKPSAIKKSLLSPQTFEMFELDEPLKKELEATWEALQELSLIKATNIPVPLLANKDKKADFDTLKEHFHRLHIATDTPNPAKEIIEALAIEQTPFKEKIQTIRKNRALLNRLNVNGLFIEMIGKWIEDNPHETDLYFLLSEIYLIEKRYDEAELYLLKVCAIAPKVLPFYYNTLANLYLQKKRLGDARYFIIKAMQGNPKNPHFYITSGKIFYEACVYENALAEYDKAIEIYKENDNNATLDIKFHLEKTTLLYELDRMDEVREIIAYLERTYPQEERVAKRKKAMLETLQKLDDEANRSELEAKLALMREDSHYYPKLICLLSGVKNQSGRVDLFERVGYHLETLNNLLYKKT